MINSKGLQSGGIMKLNDVNWRLISSYIIGAAILIAMIIAAFVFPPQKQDRWMSLMLLIGGISVGWIIGIIMSPYTAGEKTKFESYMKAVASFLSGYVVAHLNDLIKHIMKTEFLGNPLHLFQLILLLASFCVSVVLVYYTREYA
jgi:MFS family permease